MERNASKKARGKKCGIVGYLASVLQENLTNTRNRILVAHAHNVPLLYCKSTNIFTANKMNAKTLETNAN